MSDIIDTENPAVASLTQVPPALIQEVAGNPSAAQPIFRAMTLIQAHEIFMQRHALNAGQKMAFMESMAKMGDMQPKPQNSAQTGNGFSLVINLPPTGTGEAKTIEVKGSSVVDAEEV